MSDYTRTFIQYLTGDYDDLVLVSDLCPYVFMPHVYVCTSHILMPLCLVSVWHGIFPPQIWNSKEEEKTERRRRSIYAYMSEEERE